jgi:hypothetical protein
MQLPARVLKVAVPAVAGLVIVGTFAVIGLRRMKPDKAAKPPITEVQPPPKPDSTPVDIVPSPSPFEAGKKPEETRGGVVGLDSRPAHYSLVVYSRDTPLSPGAKFRYDDEDLGGLASGELWCEVRADRLSNHGPLQLNWIVDDRKYSTPLNMTNTTMQKVKYENKPWAGSYRVALIEGGRERGSVTFTIEPAGQE